MKTDKNFDIYGLYYIWEYEDWDESGNWTELGKELIQIMVLSPDKAKEIAAACKARESLVLKEYDYSTKEYYKSDYHVGIFRLFKIKSVMDDSCDINSCMDAVLMMRTNAVTDEEIKQEYISDDWDYTDDYGYSSIKCPLIQYYHQLEIEEE